MRFIMRVCIHHKRTAMIFQCSTAHRVGLVPFRGWVGCWITDEINKTFLWLCSGSQLTSVSCCFNSHLELCMGGELIRHKDNILCMCFSRHNQNCDRTCVFAWHSALRCRSLILHFSEELLLRCSAVQKLRWNGS